MPELTGQITQVSGYGNIDYVVFQCLADLEEGDTTKYQKFLQWAIFCLKTELRVQVVPQIAVAYLAQDPSVKTVDLPLDYLDYTKIGLCVNGKVVLLGLNDDLCLPRNKDICGDIQSALSSVDELSVESTGYLYVNHFRGGQYVGEMFGIGGGFTYNYYRIDKARRQIVLDGDVPGGEIVLEYKSTGVGVDGSAVVENHVMPALRQYIHWQNLKFSSYSTINERADAERQYNAAVGMIIDVESDFTIQEYLDMHYRSASLGPKR